MDHNFYQVELKRLERVQKALIANNMQATIVQTSAEVAPLVEKLLPIGCTIANGGSVTLQETNVMPLLRNGNYHYLDRDAEGADIQQIYRQAFSSDFYFASANAITENGEIYEMDGGSNRIAALAFGPTNVILVAGYNKIVPDINAARLRNASIAAPANALRVGAKTPCAITGVCSNCKSPDRICCSELILRHQRIKGRIHVILVKETLGY